LTGSSRTIVWMSSAQNTVARQKWDLGEERRNRAQTCPICSLC
jgi:hypothetical protein